MWVERRHEDPFCHWSKIDKLLDEGLLELASILIQGEIVWLRLYRKMEPDQFPAHAKETIAQLKKLKQVEAKRCVAIFAE